MRSILTVRGSETRNAGGGSSIGAWGCLGRNTFLTISGAGALQERAAFCEPVLAEQRESQFFIFGGLNPLLDCCPLMSYAVLLFSLPSLPFLFACTNF